MLATPKLRINNHNVLGMAASKSSDLTYKVVQKDISSRNPSSFSGLQQPLFILTGHRFSPNKSSDVDEKTSHRSCLRWKPTSRIFNTVSLRWVPTGKIFTSSTTKVASEPLNGSNEDITNLHECEQTCNPPSSVVSPRLPDAAPLPVTDTTHLQQTYNCSYPSSEESSSQGVIPSNFHQLNQSFINLRKWTKDHLLDNVIGNLDYLFLKNSSGYALLCQKTSRRSRRVMVVSLLKNRFETYVKSKDLDLWHVITDGNFPPIQNNPETKKDEVVPFHKQNDDLKKKLAKNNEAKMKARNESSDDDSSTFDSEDKEYAIAVKDFKKFFKRRGRFIISSKNVQNNQNIKIKKAFVGGSWSDSDEDKEERTKCLIAKALNEEILKKFGLEDSKPIKNPMSTETKLMRDKEGESVDNTKYRGMIGSLLYLTASRPDIMFSVCLCARFQEDPKTSHLEAVKCIFRYIKGTTHLGLWYPKGSGIETIVYADSDHAGDYMDCKSTSGVCTFMGCCLTSWFPKKQTALAISTTEAEYVSVRKACQQALWMKQALIDYDVRLDDIPIMCDNKGAIDLSKNPVQHSRTKHIEICHHFLRDNVQKGNISIENVTSEYNIADILTKPLKQEPFNYLRLGLGMMEQID
ncbi:hypothetical protein Tco_0617833 [Tanacetum coccineum]